MADKPELIHCSFCDKTQQEVETLIAGPNVYICKDCIDMCHEIIYHEIRTEEKDSI